MTQNIACPLCNTGIPVEINLLLQGYQFKCPNPTCDASISMDPSSTAVASEAINKFNDLKEQMKQMKADPDNTQIVGS